MKRVNEIIKIILELKVIELIHLSKLLGSYWKVDSKDMAGQGRAPEANAFVRDKKYNINLISIGLNKISIIKEIRTMLSLGLKEAKVFIESIPKIIKSQVNRLEADNMKNRLEALGASVQIV